MSLHPIRLRAKSELHMGPDEFKDYAKQIKELKSIRGHFLEIIIGIEENINLFIEKSIIPKNSRFRLVLKEHFLYSRKMSLASKIDLLSEIINVRKDLNKKDADVFYKSLKLVNEERNKWAHGSIFFEQKTIKGKRTMQSYLKYINSKGKEAEIELTDKYFDDLNEKLKNINDSITRILIKIKFLPKETKKAKDKG